MMFRWIAALAAAALLLIGCGGGDDRTKARLRLVNASSGYAELELNVDGQLRQGAVGYGATASYVEVDPNDAASTLTRPGSATALLSFTPALTKGQHYSVLAYGAQGALKQLQLDDNAGEPDGGKTLLRVVNAAPDAGALDVYITGADDLLAASVPVQSGAAVGAVGPWFTVDSATWRLRISAAGSKTDLRLDLPALVAASKQVATLVLTPGRGGVLVSALLLQQQGEIGRQDATQARVRVAAGVAAGAAVTAAVAGSTLLSNTASPVVGVYALLPAGSQPVAVAVAGTALPASTAMLSAGADYTLLVHGTAASPLVSWIEDDNHLPADSSQARLRLVNGVAGLATPLAMTADLVPVADNVAAGSGSAYAALASTTTARLSVTAPGLAAPLFGAVDQVLLPGANYSVFVLGDAAAAAGTLRKDR
ncbi:MAG: DUF4397 domain-containing protein [Burkholderiaceae bacterium]|nr:DUF4397 domain-containing protein [Burkholderiaceae bacterium]